MFATRRVAAAALLAVALATTARAQQDAPATTAPTSTSTSTSPAWSAERARELYAQYYRPISDDPSEPGYYEPASASVLRYHTPVRRTAARAGDGRSDARVNARYDSRADARYDSRDDTRARIPSASTAAASRPDDDYGIRNPGGVGRKAEYYPPGNQFQNEGDPVRVAGHDTGVGLSREDQYRATEIGIARYNSVQQHIDRYAQPFIGFGWGFGGFGGFGAPF